MLRAKDVLNRQTSAITNKTSLEDMISIIIKKSLLLPIETRLV
jgi:hypothetical protein